MTMAESIATRDAYGKTLARLGEQYPEIVALDADLCKSTKTVDFFRKFPARSFNMGIAEQNMMGWAAGLAVAGKIPFASTFAVFAAGRAFEQIRNTIGYCRLNVRIVATHAGISVGPDGSSHQALEDVSCMRSIPNMTVIVPADGPETEKAIEATVKHQGPVYVRLGRAKVPTVTDPGAEFVIGKSKMLKTGKDATIIAAGAMVSKSLEAAELSGKKGINVRVINMSTIKPVDSAAIISAARETGAIVTAEEHNVIGGLGSAVAEVTGENFPVPMKRVGMQDVFGESGEVDELFAKYRLTAEDIAEAVEEVIKKKKQK